MNDELELSKDNIKFKKFSLDKDNESDELIEPSFSIINDYKNPLIELKEHLKASYSGNTTILTELDKIFSGIKENNIFFHFLLPLLYIDKEFEYFQKIASNYESEIFNCYEFQEKINLDSDFFKVKLMKYYIENPRKIPEIYLDFSNKNGLIWITKKILRILPYSIKIIEEQYIKSLIENDNLLLLEIFMINSNNKSLSQSEKKKIYQLIVMNLFISFRPEKDEICYNLTYIYKILLNECIKHKLIKISSIILKKCKSMYFFLNFKLKFYSKKYF